ncbi:MAG: hypothetical protein OXD44_03910 [Gammaproteobacteria bacterium]|nr:hypothetical protein [Gammaproteobacteria bacterium]
MVRDVAGERCTVAGGERTGLLKKSGVVKIMAPIRNDLSIDNATDEPAPYSSPPYFRHMYTARSREHQGVFRSGMRLGKERISASSI